MAEAIDEKQFSLKDIELRMLQVLQETYFTNLSNFMSFIALERLAYQVTPNTQFRLDEGKLYIHEKEPQPETSEAPKEDGKTENPEEVATA